MKVDFYIRCMGCNATRKLLSPANGGKYPAGMDCPLCEDGYHFAGVSEGQLARVVKQNEELLVAAKQAFDALVGAHAADDSVQGKARIALRSVLGIGEGRP